MACDGNCKACQENIFRDSIPPVPQYSEKEFSSPTAAVVSVTNRCNMACPYCFHTQSDSDMTLETAEQTVRFLMANAYRKNKKPFIGFFGGEPLLVFDSIIKPLVEKYSGEFEWTITTNGTLLTKEIVDFVADNSGAILLSIDGPRQVQDYQRPLRSGGSGYEKLQDIIPYLLVKLPDTIYRATVTRYSLDYLNEMMADAVKFGFKHVNLVPNLFEEWTQEDYEKWEYFIDGEALKLMDAILLDRPLDYVYDPLVNAYKVIARNNTPTGDILPLPHFRCGMGNSCIGVSPDGSLHPCQEDNGFNKVNSVGNVFSGIDIEKHVQYYDMIFKKWEDALPLIAHLHETPSFKRFIVEEYCPTRLREGYSFNSTHLMSARALHRAAARLVYRFSRSMNARAKAIFE